LVLAWALWAVTGNQLATASGDLASFLASHDPTVMS